MWAKQRQCGPTRNPLIAVGYLDELLHEQESNAEGYDNFYLVVAIWRIPFGMPN